MLMRVRMRNFRVCALAAIIAIGALGSFAPASADPIEIDGFVPLKTVPVTDLTSFFITGDLSGPDTVDLVGVPPVSPQPVLPVNLTFDGTGLLSGDAFGGVIQHSLVNATTPTGPDGADTILDIGAPVTLNNIGDSGTTDIQIVALDLVSVAPIEIDFGAGTQFFDVFVMLDPSATQLPGSVTFTRTGENAGTYLYTIPETLLVNFVEVGNASNSFSGVANTIIEGEGSFSESVPEPGMLLIVAGGLVLLAARRRAA
ncbi:MAG: hypothetical protein VW547_02220 [Alphaproteobacteria bacterium]